MSLETTLEDLLLLSSMLSIKSVNRFLPPILFDVGSNVAALEARNRFTLLASVPLGPLIIGPRDNTGLTKFFKTLTNKSSTCNEASLWAPITDINPSKRI